MGMRDHALFGDLTYQNFVVVVQADHGRRQTLAERVGNNDRTMLRPISCKGIRCSQVDTDFCHNHIPRISFYIYIVSD